MPYQYVWHIWQHCHAARSVTECLFSQKGIDIGSSLSSWKSSPPAKPGRFLAGLDTKEKGGHVYRQSKGSDGWCNDQMLNTKCKRRICLNSGYAFSLLGHILFPILLSTVLMNIFPERHNNLLVILTVLYLVSTSIVVLIRNKTAEGL